MYPNRWGVIYGTIYETTFCYNTFIRWFTGYSGATTCTKITRGPDYPWLGVNGLWWDLSLARLQHNARRYSIIVACL